MSNLSSHATPHDDHTIVERQEGWDPPKRPAVLKLRRLLRNRAAVISAAILTVFVCMAIFAPYIAPTHPNVGDIRLRLEAPSSEFPLGTDQQGRNMISRIVYGSRVALIVGFSTVAMGVVLGGILGILAGYTGGAVDGLIMRVMDIILSFPYIMLVIAIVSMLGAGLRNTVLAIGFANIPQFARIVRGVVLGLREREFITAADALGGSHLRRIVYHIIPNSLAPMIITATLFFGRNVLAEATLSFLGLGIQPPTAAWGTMVASGRGYLIHSPHLALIPGVALMLFVYALNMFGDALRDALDPRAIE